MMHARQMPLNDNLRVTECANPLTQWLDEGSSDDIVRMLAACDGGLFSGYAGLANLYSTQQARSAARVALAIARALRHASGRVVFGGCGTSGRLAHLLARELNACWSSLHPSDSCTRFHYLLAGGDAALLVPNEAVEDEHEAGRHDLEAWERQYGVLPTHPTVVIGISCGLSATYVASFLRASAARPSYFPVAMGFNPIGAVAAVVVPGCPFTFHSVLCALTGASGACTLPDGSAMPADLPTRAAVLNPVIGPEAVAGSSRMKGGSITWILCSSICSVALTLVGEASDSTDMHVQDGEGVPEQVVQWVRDRYQSFEGVVRALYGYHTEGIACILQRAADSLSSRVPAVLPSGPGPVFSWPVGTGRILYIGRGAGGLLGLVDASEATDTYGSRFDHVRGWVAGGAARMGVQLTWLHPTVPHELRGMHGGQGAGEDVPVQQACPSLASFVSHVIPTLVPQDTVIVVDVPQPCDSAEVARDELQAVLDAATAVQHTRASLHHVFITGGADSSAQEFCLHALLALGSTGVHLPLVPQGKEVDGRMQGLLTSLLAVQAAKLVLNAVTTGAHISKGVIVGNRMVNMMLTNHKLYMRAIGIVREVAQVPQGQARRAVLRAIHGEDDEERVGGMVQQEDANAEVMKSRIALASVQDRVIPTALLLALAAAQGAGKESLTVASARALLDKEPAVRAALALL